MDGVSVILGIVVASVAFYLVANPLVNPPQSLEEGEGEIREGQEELLAALAEVEQDYQLGKITAEDYNFLKEKYGAQAIKGAAQVERKAAKKQRSLEARLQKELEQELERELAEIRKKVTKSR